MYRCPAPHGAGIPCTTIKDDTMFRRMTRTALEWLGDTIAIAGFFAAMWLALVGAAAIEDSAEETRPTYQEEDSAW